MKRFFGIFGTGKKKFVATTFIAGAVAVAANQKIFIPVAEGVTIIVIATAIHTLLIQIFRNGK